MVRAGSRGGWIPVVLLLGLAAGCGASGGGGGGGGGPVIGSLCDPATQKETCSGSARVQCTAAATGGATWTLIEVCPTTGYCSVVQSVQPGLYYSQCTSSGAQADGTTSSDGTGVSTMDTKGKDTTTSTGCVPVDCDDGIACTEDVCLAGKCKNTPDDAQCEDGNPCTKDLCQGGGCKYQSLANQPCNDGDMCTSGDTCTAAKTCVGKVKNCDDGDPCTADSCANGQCQHEKTTGCADGSSMDGALPIAVAKQQQGDLAKGPLWYTFDGDAGDVIGVVLNSAQASSPYDPQIIDTVIEVWYGGKPIAANDDNPEGSDNDSFLITMLPQSGTYYVKVSECWDWLAANPNPNLSCAAPQAKSQTDFAVVLLNNAQLSPPFAQAESEPNDVKTAANLVTYETNSQGKYLISSLVGQLASSDKGDWYALQPPSDVPVTEGRATAYFTTWTPGLPLGTGSSLTSMTASLVDATGAVVAQLTSDAPRLSVPVKLGTKYYLQLSAGQSSGSGKPFYVVDHYTGGSNPLEKQEQANNSLATAEPLATPVAGAGGSKVAYIGGDLIDQGSDVDYFSVAVPSGLNKLSVYCGAASTGSGLQGFSVSVLNSAGQPVSGGSGTESGDTLVLTKVAVSGSKILVKLSATGQNPSVTGTFYQCGFVFQQ